MKEVLLPAFAGTSLSISLCSLCALWLKGLPLHLVAASPRWVSSVAKSSVFLWDTCERYFQRLLPFFYNSPHTSIEKLDGLKIFPDDSELVELMRKAVDHEKTKGSLSKSEPSEK